MCEIHSNKVGNAKSFGSRKISLCASMCRVCHMDRVLVMRIRKAHGTWQQELVLLLFVDTRAGGGVSSGVVEIQLHFRFDTTSSSSHSRSLCLFHLTYICMTLIAPNLSDIFLFVILILVLNLAF